MFISFPVIVWILFIAVVLHSFYTFVIHPTFISPLRKIPLAHPSAHISSAWITWVRYCRRENRVLKALHDEKGPVVRLGPRELSVNCVKDGIRSVYGGGFEKHAWYHSFENLGLPNMFSMMNSEPHAIRKRMLANIYSKSFLQRSAALDAQSANIIYCRLLPLLDRHAIVKKPIEIYEVFLGTSMDFITAYSFGLSTSSNFIEDVEERRRWIGLYQCRHPYSFYTQEVRGVTTWLCQLGVRLVPQSVDVATQAMESWCAEMCDLAGSKLDLSKMVHGNEISPVDYPVAYGQLRDSLRKRRSKANDEEKVEFLEQEKLEIASEMCDHMIAGHETSGITLTYLTYELSKNQKLQQLLRNELLEMSPSYRSLHIDQTGDVDSLELPSPTDLDALPLLNAIVQETFRLYPAIAGGQARVTPTNKTVKLGDYDAIPGGIRVGARASTLHQNPDVFPSPTEFQPQRWLDATPEQRAEMHRWLWVFGSGGRMCIGSNFAIHEIKIVAAALYSNYHTSIVDAPDMRPSDAYSGNPTGGKLLINVQRV